MTSIVEMRKRKAINMVIIVLASTILFVYFLHQRDHRRKSVVVRGGTGEWNNSRDLKESQAKASKERCKPPSIDPFHEQVRPYIKRGGSVNCIRKTNKTTKIFESAAFIVEEGRYLRRIVDVGVPCCVKLIDKIEKDDDIDVSEVCIPLKDDILEIESTIEFVAVMCQDNKTNKVVYVNAFPMIHKKRSKVPPTSPGRLNVLMLGLDSSSQLNFMRTMPLTHDFLIRNLSAILLRGYNVVGDCTHANIIPLLSGQSASRFRDSCAKPQQLLKKQVKLDNCSLLWNKFARRGYLTSWVEDYSRWSPFYYYYPKAFEKTPTDYYLSPVAVYSSVLKDYYQQDFKCLGPRPSFEVEADFLQTVAEVNKKGPLFQVALAGGLVYYDMNDQKSGDEILLSLLQDLLVTRILDNTALFIFGDHGFRKNKFRYTEKGAVEVRMPIGFIVLPQWFQVLYPDYYTNLIQNSQKMISHFDIHQTMIDIADLAEADDDPDDVNEERNSTAQDLADGTSLFRSIDKDRTCLSAGIPLFWCLHCYPKNYTVENDTKIQVADFLLITLKQLGWNNICDPSYVNLETVQNFTLKAISNISKWDFRDVHRELCSSTGEGIVVPGYFGQESLTLNISCEGTNISDLDIEIIDIQIETMDEYEFSAEFIRYRRKNNYYLHLTEDILFI